MHNYNKQLLWYKTEQNRNKTKQSKTNQKDLKIEQKELKEITKQAVNVQVNNQLLERK